MIRYALCGAAALALISTPAYAQGAKPSSGRNEQARGMADIPQCAQPIGTIAIVEPENQWWREMSLGSPEAIIRVFVQRSGCFTMVNRGRSLASRAM